jgi:hypothetical protein
MRPAARSTEVEVELMDCPIPLSDFSPSRDAQPEAGFRDGSN